MLKVTEYISRSRIFMNIIFFIISFIFSSFKLKNYIAGFLICLAGEAIRIWASGCIRKDEELAVDGPYSMVRNPLYLGSFIISAGIGIGWNVPFIFFIYLPFFAVIYTFTIKKEEEKLRLLFTHRFEEYRKKTPCFLPLTSPRNWKLKGTKFTLSLVFKNKEHKTLLLILLSFFMVAIKEYLMSKI